MPGFGDRRTEKRLDGDGQVSAPARANSTVSAWFSRAAARLTTSLVHPRIVIVGGRPAGWRVHVHYFVTRDGIADRNSWSLSFAA